jgi:hypothetical protein
VLILFVQYLLLHQRIDFISLLVCYKKNRVYANNDNTNCNQQQMKYEFLNPVVTFNFILNFSVLLYVLYFGCRKNLGLAFPMSFYYFFSLFSTFCQFHVEDDVFPFDVRLHEVRNFNNNNNNSNSSNNLQTSAKHFEEIISMLSANKCSKLY